MTTPETNWIEREIGGCRIVEKIGEGGCAEVFRGTDCMLGRPVAIKVLHPRLSGREDFAERFRSEAHTMARLAHPNVATLYSFHLVEDDGTEVPVMVMEFVEGDTFENLLKREGPMPAPRALTLLIQALHGIEHAHAAGIVHRDLKATNVMLSDAGIVKVMDFGVAQVFGERAATDRPVGTPEYMSPEQIRSEPLDGRSDVYSLGVLLFKLLSGRLPIRAESPKAVMRAQLEQPPRPIRELVPGIAEPVARLVERALAKRAGDRFRSAEDFRGALEELAADLEEETDGAPAPLEPDAELGPTEVLFPPAAFASQRPRWLRAGAWGAVGVALAAIALAFVLRSEPAPPDREAPLASTAGRLPPLAPGAPVGFEQWPPNPVLYGEAAANGVLRAEDLGIAVAKLEPAPSEASAPPPPREKARARSAPKVHNPPASSVAESPARAPRDAAEEIPANGGESGGNSSWVIRR